MLKERNHALYDALRSFSIEALKCVENSLKQGAYLPVRLEDSWFFGKDDCVFQKGQVEKPQYWRLFDRAQKEISSLAIYQQVSEMALADAIWGSQINTLVGSLKGKHRVSMDTLLTSFPLNSLSKSNQLDFSEQYFNEQVERIERLFRQTEVEFVQVTPLYGIDLQNKVSISGDISIEPLSNELIIELLDAGVISSEFVGIANEYLHNPPRAAIVIRFSLPKVIGENPMTKEDHDYLRKLFDSLRLTETLLIDLLALIFNEPIRPTGNLVREESSIFVTSRQIRKYEVMNSWSIKSQTFEGEHENKLLALWPLLNDNSKKSIHYLTLAIRRFSLALNRPSGDDKLIDLMICAEALFLRVEQGELTYKLSHRAALLLGGDAAEQREIFSFFGKAYAMRSKVVHGATSYSRNQSEIEELTNTAQRLTEYLRATISYMLDLAMLPHATAELINWKDFIFQDRPIAR